jgi:putative heme transporter
VDHDVVAERERRRVHPAVAVAAAYGWRFLVLAAVVVVLRWLLAKLWVIVFALAVALFITRGLAAPNRWLRARGLPAAVAALASVLVFLGVIVLIGLLIAPAAGDEFASLGPTLSAGIDDVQDWLVNRSPFDISQRSLARFKTQVGESALKLLRSSSGSLLSGAVAAAEGVGGIVLGLISTFFFLKDGPQLRTWWLERLPSDRREVAERMGARAWATIGAYLRGAATLGIVEGAIIGTTLALVGASLVIPVMVLTFVSAFVPFVGAIVAGLLAVLVALATAGPVPALIVAVVALAVQQLDNDLLAPFIYGHALKLHPLVVLFAIVAGSALSGFAGAILAVPVTAVTINVIAEARNREPRPSIGT